MPEQWLHCECGEPLYKWIGKVLPMVGTVVRSKDFEGVQTGSKVVNCPACNECNYFYFNNIHEIENA